MFDRAKSSSMDVIQRGNVLKQAKVGNSSISNLRASTAGMLSIADGAIDNCLTGSLLVTREQTNATEFVPTEHFDNRIFEVIM